MDQRRWRATSWKTFFCTTTTAKRTHYRYTREWFLIHDPTFMIHHPVLAHLVFTFKNMLCTQATFSSAFPEFLPCFLSVYSWENMCAENCDLGQCDLQQTSPHTYAHTHTYFHTPKRVWFLFNCRVEMIHPRSISSFRISLCCRASPATSAVKLKMEVELWLIN